MYPNKKFNSISITPIFPISSIRINSESSDDVTTYETPFYTCIILSSDFKHLWTAFIIIHTHTSYKENFERWKREINNIY